MANQFDKNLVIAISSRALFDLEAANKIFETEGLDAYRDYQLANEDVILDEGPGFSLVKNLLSLNEAVGKKVVEVIVMSRNSAETSLRIMNSIDHYNLDIKRMMMSGGEDISRYLKPFRVDLFLSCNEEDVTSAVNRGYAAGVIYNGYKYNDIPEGQIRIAFDADAVLFSAESEEIFQKHGLDAFVQNEIENQDKALEQGPMAGFLMGLAKLQNQLQGTDKIRTAIVTARDKDSGRRVIKTLRKWNININEIFFLSGADKAEVLESFGANIFFDDQEKNALPAASVVPSARVPYKKG